jgi:hypothetical protein
MNGQTKFKKSMMTIKNGGSNKKKQFLACLTELFVTAKEIPNKAGKIFTKNNIKSW